MIALLHNTEIFVKVCEKYSIIFVIVSQSTRECTFIPNIRLSVPRTSSNSKWLSSSDSTSMLRRRQDGRCTTVVVQWRCKFITKKEIGLPAIISMQNKPNPFLCHPGVLDSHELDMCFLLNLFYSQFGILKTCKHHFFQIYCTTWSHGVRVQRHDDVM